MNSHDRTYLATGIFTNCYRLPDNCKVLLFMPYHARLNRLEDCWMARRTCTLLSVVDSIAIVIGQAYQLARVRLASAASPIMRLMVQRDRAHSERELLRRELAILRGQRVSLPPHRRPEYRPEHRLERVMHFAHDLPM